MTRSPHPADARSQVILPTRIAITLLGERHAPLAAGLVLLAAALDARERAVVVGYLGAATVLTTDTAVALRGR